jgi:hypothetical protein
MNRTVNLSSQLWGVDNTPSDGASGKGDMWCVCGHGHGHGHGRCCLDHLGKQFRHGPDLSD